MRLAEQGRLWSGAYALLVVLVLACAAVLWRSPRASAAAGADEDVMAAPAIAPDASPAASAGSDATATLARRLRWVGFAFVPSSLMLGVTTTITTDIAPIPLLWALPLSLYLVSFILVFAPGARSDGLWRAMVVALPWVVLLISLILLLEVRGSVWLSLWVMVPIHLAGFFVIAVVCHGPAHAILVAWGRRVAAADRPAELADAVSELPAERRQPLRTEDQQHDHQDDQQLRGAR